MQMVRQILVIVTRRNVMVPRTNVARHQDSIFSSYTVLIGNPVKNTGSAWVIFLLRLLLILMSLSLALMTLETAGPTAATTYYCRLAGPVLLNSHFTLNTS